MSKHLKTEQKTKKPKKMPASMYEVMAKIAELQSDRIDSQRAELRPIPKSPKPSKKGASLPGLRPQQTISVKPEDDFVEMIARVQGTRLDDQRTELPGQPQKESEPDEDIFSQIMRAQAGRMEDQRATIPLKEQKGNMPGTSKK